MASVSRPPPAPSRPRRALTTRAGPPPTQQSDEVDQLADDLGASLSLKAGRKATTATQRVPTAAPSRTAGATLGTTASSSKPAVSSSLKRAVKPEAAQENGAPPAERARIAMLLINSSLSALLTIRKSGWRASQASPSSTPSASRPASSASSSSKSAGGTRLQVEKHAADCGKALHELRELIRDGLVKHKPSDIERATGTLIGHLVDMELYRFALPLLASMRAAILSWYTSTTLLAPSPSPALATASSRSSAASSKAPTSLSTFVPLLSFPVPAASFFSPPTLEEAVTPGPARPTREDLVPLVLLIQQYVLGCLFRSDEWTETERTARAVAIERLWSAACGPGDWRRLLGEGVAGLAMKDEQPKRVDALMTSMFGTLTKGLVGADTTTAPSTLLYLRSRALLFYSTTSALYSSADKLSAFYDQTRKVLLLFGRQAESQKIGDGAINERVKAVFREVVNALEVGGKQAEGVHDWQGEGSKWNELGEVVMHIARRADDLKTVSSVASMLSGPTSSPSASSSAAATPPDVPPETQIAQLCAKLVNSLAALEVFFKSGEDKGFSDHTLRLLNLIPSVTRLRALPPSSTLVAPHSKIDKILERLRYVVARWLRGEKRVDQLMLGGGEKRSELTEEEISKRVLGRKLLEALVVHAESVFRISDGTTFPGRSALYDSTVETLLQLAYSHLVVDARSTHAPALSYLERSLPFLRGPSAATNAEQHQRKEDYDLDAHYSIRSTASTCYNIAGKLFNAGKPDSALGFSLQAAEVSQGAFDLWESITSVESALAGLSVQDGPQLDERLAQRRKERDDAMKELGEKYLSKRWELLALCQHSLGHKSEAHRSYTRSVLAYPPSVLASLAAQSHHTSSSSLVAPEPNLLKLITRVTKLGTFDLLAPSTSVSLRAATQEQGLSDEVQAVLLEMQMASLDQSLDKRETSAVIAELVGDLLDLYDAERYPVRRARTLVRRMQQQCSPGNAVQDLSAAASAAEIDALCSRSSLGKDEELRPFAPQFVAFSHLWLAFHAHYAQLPSAAEATSSEARQALQILSAALEHGLPPSPSAPAKKPTTPVRPAAEEKAAVVAPTTTRRRAAVKSAAVRAKEEKERKALAFKTPQVSRTLPGSRRLISDQITPPRSSSLATEVTASPKRGGTPTLLLDHPQHCYKALETMANLLGALGYSLLKMSYLKFLRRLSSRLGDISNTSFVTISANLGHEYVLLGRTARAGLVFAQADSRVHSAAKTTSPVAPSAQLSYYTLYAEYLALLGNHDRSAQAYTTAQTIAETLVPDESSPSVSARIVERTLFLQRSALAAGVSSVLFQRRGDLNRSLHAALQAMRVWSRASANLARIAAAEVADAPESTTAPFISISEDPNAALPDHPLPARKRPVTTFVGPHAGLSWLLAEALGSSILRVATLYALRGTVKSAEHYSQAANDLAQDLGARRLMARALAVRVEARLRCGNLEGAEVDLEMMDGVLDAVTCPEAVDAQRLHADLQMRQEMAAEAHLGYLEAQRHLDSFVQDAADGETTHGPERATPSKHLSPAQHRSASRPSPAVPSPSLASPRVHSPSDSTLPSFQTYLLRVRINLLRLEGRHDESASLLHQLALLSVTDEDKADESKLLASIQFTDLLKRFNADPVLGMISDSVLSIPTLAIPAVAAVKITSPKSAPTLLNCLREVETLLNKATAMSVSRSEPAKLRELSLLTATLRALQISIGRPSKRSAASVSHILDLGLAVTLRREMLEAIDHKLADAVRHDDLHWPLLEPHPSVNSEDAEDAEDAELVTKHWTALRDRYRSEAAEASLTDRSLSSLLPQHWTTISIHLSPERDCLLLVRHRREVEPVVFKLPLDRLARREGEEESFTYDLALEELQDIITANNAAAQHAKHVTGKEERAEWWAERKDLDGRLKTLVQTIEDDWLGAFKSVFCDVRAAISPELFASFKARVERILKRSISRTAQDRKASRFKLDDSILACLAALPASSREEDFEDLYHFMTESFQFSGVPVACDETDVDQVVVDLRSAFEELQGAAGSQGHLEEQHLFLILDKAVQSFPWESIPCLRGRSISRIPSLAFLRDRIDLASSLASDRGEHEPEPREIVVDTSKTSFLLNPAGDLKTTQNTFEPWLKQMQETAGWNGIIARLPSDEEVKVALSTSQLFLYFGHGGAEQYVRSQTIRHLPRCATTMLWGCSSGLLKDQGDFDPVGTPNHYMIAGCPALVANLWDVTDKDIDKIAQNTFRLLGLDSHAPAPPSVSQTIASAVAQSRDVPLLKYLNGSAPVVYGVPVRFTRPA